jgi:hypothetical protein
MDTKDFPWAIQQWAKVHIVHTTQIFCQIMMVITTTTEFAVKINLMI